MGVPMGQESDLYLDRSQRSLRRIVLDHSFRPTACLAGPALDAPTEEIEPIIDMGQVGLVFRETQARRRQHCGHLTEQRFNLGAGPRTGTGKSSALRISFIAVPQAQLSRPRITTDSSFRPPVSVGDGSPHLIRAGCPGLGGAHGRFPRSLLTVQRDRRRAMPLQYRRGCVALSPWPPRPTTFSDP